MDPFVLVLLIAGLALVACGILHARRVARRFEELRDLSPEWGRSQSFLGFLLRGSNVREDLFFALRSCGVQAELLPRDTSHRWSADSWDGSRSLGLIRILGSVITLVEVRELTLGGGNGQTKTWYSLEIYVPDERLTQESHFSILLKMKKRVNIPLVRPASVVWDGADAGFGVMDRLNGDPHLRAVLLNINDIAILADPLRKRWEIAAELPTSWLGGTRTRQSNWAELWPVYETIGAYCSDAHLALRGKELSEGSTSPDKGTS